MPKLRITLAGHLLVAGGQATGLGVDLATARRWVEGQEVPYIPATSLRGAVRLQLEALLQGANYPATGPYPFDAAAPLAGTTPDDAVARLFGYSGPGDSRRGAREGQLRFSDALPVPDDRDRARRALTVRAGVEIDDHTATAADQKLYFREVAELDRDPLVFEAELATGSADDQLCGWLRAAIETTDAVGAGKSKGGGAVQIEWLDEDTSAGVVVQGDPATATRARLSFELLEPAHFGDGGARGNHQATRTFVPGATLRGALAWALLRNGVSPEDVAFQGLFCGQVSFGDALLTPGDGADPFILPATLLESRTGHPGRRRDKLADELARERVNQELRERGLWFRPDEGKQRLLPVETSRPAAGLLRRTRTRVSIDRHTGTAASGRLFSIEHVEPPWRPGAEAGEPGRSVPWVATIEGLDPADQRPAELLAQLAGLPVLVGSGRNHGLGKVRLQIQFEAAPFDLQIAGEQALELDQVVESRRREMLARAGLDAGSQQDDVPFALVAQSDYVPSRSEPEAQHPLAEIALSLPPTGPVRRFLLQGSVGGYDLHPDRHREGGAGEPLKNLNPAVGAGSVFVYSVERSQLLALLAQALPALRRGVGREITSGCGRFALFEDRSTREVVHET